MQKQKRFSRPGLLLVELLIVVSMIGCSNLEPQLKKLASDPALTVVVKDDSDVHWAFNSSGIKEVTGNKITLKEGTVVAKGSGTAPSDEITRTVIELRSKANPGGFGATESNVSGASGTISAKIEVLAAPVSISVAAIVSPKA